MVMKDNSSYLVSVANIDTVHTAVYTYSHGKSYRLKIQVRGVAHELSYNKDEALRDADYERLKQAGQH